MFKTLTQMKQKLQDVINLKKLLTKGKHIWRIHSSKELLEFAKLVNQQGKNFDGRVIKLECDIDLSDLQWEPIGNSFSHPFSGEFDGQGHSIRGLRFQADSHFIGFFGVLKGAEPMGVAEVRNLSLLDIVLSGTTDSSWTGGIAGYAGEGTLIENCHVKGEIRSWSFVGGIVGVVDGSIGIRECNIEGIIVGENLASVFTKNNVAGAIAGKYTTNSILRGCNYHVFRDNGSPLSTQVGKFDNNSYGEPGTGLT